MTDTSSHSKSLQKKSFIEFTDRIETLPPELMDQIRHGGGANIYHEVQQAQAPPVVHASTNNPLLLFLQTLLPGPVPNAPPLQQGQQQQNNNTQSLLNLLNFLNIEPEEGDEDD